MRASRGFWGICAVLLGVLYVLAGNAAAYDISGTVSNGTGKSGRIYLSVQRSGGGGTGLGVSIPSAGPYTIRGVPTGTYSVQAFMDTQLPQTGVRHASDPVGMSPTFTVSDAPVSSGADVALKEPSPPALTRPQSAQATAGDGVAFVMWEPARLDGAEVTRFYTVYWSDTPDPGPANRKGQSPELPSPAKAGYLAKGLPNGTPYYFSVTARLASGGTESAPTKANGGMPLTIGAAPNGHTIAGTVTSAAIAKSGSTPLWVAAVPHDRGPVAIGYIASPADAQGYTIAGVPPGTYHLYAILDMNGSDTIDAGDYMTAESRATSVTVINGDLSGADFALAPQDAEGAVGTRSWNDASGRKYSLEFAARGVHTLPVNVSVSGPQITGSLDMALEGDEGGRFRSWIGVPTMPKVSPTPDSYSFLVSYADGTSASALAEVTGLLDGFATPTAPVGKVDTATPTFTWTAPANLSGIPYWYRINLDGNGTHWSSEALPSGQLSLTYNANGGAPPLMPGGQYSWNVTVSDSRENSAGSANASFSVGSLPGTAAGSYSYDAAGKVLTLNWAKSDFPCEGPRLGTESDTVTALTETTLAWVDPSDSMNSMTWTRGSGAAGDLSGTWNTTDPSSGNSYTITFNADKSVAATGTINRCGGTAGSFPSITGFTPLSGPYGTAVTINGSGFGATSAGGNVKFNGQPAAGIVSWSDTQIVASVPSSSTASGPISVTTGAGTIFSSFYFNVYTPMPGTQISGFTPQAGAVGTQVTITGSNFDPDPAKNSVSFNGVAATVTYATSTQLVATVPAGAGNGPITVSAGGFTVSSFAPFSVITGPITFSGAVQSSAGTGISGAAVEVVGNPALTAVSAGDGSFSIANIPAGQSFTLKGSAAGSADAYLGPFFSTVDISGRSLVLYSAAEMSAFGIVSGKGAIAGKVVDVAAAATGGGYLAGAVVTASSSKHPETPYPVTYFDPLYSGGSATSTDGRFLVVNVDDGDTVTLNATKPEWKFPSKTVAVHADAVSETQIAGNTTVFPAGVLSVTPMSLYFNDYGTGYQPQTVTVTNTGTGPVTVQAPYLTGDAASFSVVSGGLKPCPQFPHTFAAQETCTLTATFVPTGTGQKSASLQFTSDATTAPLSVPMSGYVMPQSGSISGRVSSLTGSPLPWVDVQAYDAASGTTFFGNTNVDGYYLISQLPVGTYRVQFTYYGGQNPQTVYFDRGTTPETATLVTVGAGSTAPDVNAVFDTKIPGNFTISGRLLDAANKGVCGGNIYAHSLSGGGGSAMTASDGSYSISVPPGDYTLQVSYYTASPSCGTAASYPRYSAPPRSVTVGADLVEDFSLPQSYTVSGRILDPAGAPLPDVGVSFSSGYGTGSPGTGTSPGTGFSAYAMTGSDGVYSVTVYGGTYGVVLSSQSGTVTVASSLAVNGDLAGKDFTFKVAKPVIDAFSPASGKPGSEITVTGSGFGLPGYGTAVFVNGVYAPILAWSDTRVVVSVPYGATSGTISLSVQGGSVSSSQTFVVTIDQPKVVHTVPAPDAAGVPANGGIFVSFDQEMERSSINAQTFSVADAAGVPVAGAVQEREDHYLFVPAAALEPGKRYVATLASGVRSMAGASLPPYSWSFTTTDAASHTFSLENGIYNLETEHENGVANYLYDVIRLATDGSHLTDSWYAYQAATGWSASGTGAGEKEESYTLTDSGWQLDSDSPTDGVVTDNGDGSFTWTNSADGRSQRMEPVEYNLAGQPLAAFANPEDLPVQPSGSYPDGSMAYTFRTKALTDSYRVGVWRKEPGTQDENYIRYYDGTSEKAVTSLGELPQRFAAGQMNWLNGNGFAMQLGADGSVQLFQYSATSQSPVPMAVGGTWEYLPVKGAQLLVVHLPESLKNGRPSELFFAEVNGVVKQGEWTPAGAVELEPNPNYNKTAFDWMIGAPPAVPAKGNQIIGTLLFAPQGVQVGGSTVVSAAGGASGNPVVFTSLSTGVCTVSGSTGSTVTAVGAGTCTIAANQEGNASYDAAPQVTAEIVVAAAAPGAPLSVSARAGNAQASVSFAAPQFDGGSAVTGYTVTSTPAGGVDLDAGKPTLTHTVSGLANGTAYTFTVTARNAAGAGKPSAPSASVTPATVPEAPTAVGALAENGTATVSFTAPPSNGGSAITGYTVTSTPGGFSATGTQSPVVVQGLVNGTAYTFTVAATNASGTGKPSAPSASVTPDVVPGAPTAVNAARGSASAVVSFAPPEGNGGTPVTSYTVTSTPGNLSATGTASPLTLTGLVNGTSYTFTVTAANAKGKGAPSAPSAPVTPAGLPGAPAAGNAVAGNASATVTFGAPASNGGSQITGYTVTSIPAGGVDANDGSTATVHTVTGLANGTKYVFVVTATNGVGKGAPSEASNAVVPVTVPGAPTSIAATAGHAQAKVSFSPPSSDGGSAIIYYTVTATPGSIRAAGGGSPITVNGLTDGTEYFFTVTATNAAGTSRSSELSNGVVPADTVPPVVRAFSVPGAASAVNGATSVTLPVTGFSATDNVVVAGYLVTESSDRPGADAAGWSSTTPSAYAIGATAGVHTLYGWAKDAAGNVSTPYSATVVVTPKDTLAPVILSGPTVVSLSNDTAVVEWQTNEPALGGVLYGLAPSPGSALAENELKTTHSMKIGGLSSSTTYYLSVFASDASQNGPTASKEIALRTKAAPDTTAPFITEGPTVTSIGPDSATVEWRTSEPAQGSVLYGTANTLGQGAEEGAFGTAHSVKVTGLGAETLYYLKVTATDLAGNGPRESGMVSFRTVALPDTTPPVIVERPMALNVSETGATVMWKTDEPATSVVIVSDGATYGFFSDSGLGTTHSVTLTGLQGVKRYEYRVLSVDGAGNSRATETPGVFYTAAAPDRTAPVVLEGPQVVEASHQSAAIRWTTDEPADSVIEYGTTEALGSSYSQSALVRTHSLTLTGLEAGTTYYFRVLSTDPLGNGPTASRTFTVTTALDPSYKVPVITFGPEVVYRTDSSMTVYWETDDPSDSVVEYGEGGTLTQRVSSAEKVKRHQVTITNLKGNTSYKVVVSSTNMSGNTVYAKGNSAARFLAMNLGMLYSATDAVTVADFTTGSDPDSAKPVITVPPSVSGITNTQAVLSWTTDEIADSQVTYGVKGESALLSSGDTAQVKEHVVVLTNLLPSTTYSFTVASTDPSGNGPTSGSTVEFTTSATRDETAPGFVGSLTTPVLTGSGMTTIEWGTDEPATTQLRYGTSPTALNTQAAMPGLSTAHSLTLSLQPGTRYYAAAVAMDGSGNLSESTPLSFSTLGTSDVTAPVTVATPGAGSYLGAQGVTLAADEPAIIYYTTDGTTPTPASAQYNGPITVETTKTLKFFAIDQAGNREGAKSASFLIQYGVSASADENGTISCPSPVNSGETALCTVTPNPGYRGATVSGCGGSMSGANYLTGTITAGCAVTASFTPITYTVTPAVSGHGAITPATPQTVAYGASTSFSVAPAAGYRIASVTGCAGTLSGTSYTVPAPSGSCTVTATFTPSHAVGDLNRDGAVDVGDAIVALRMAADLIVPTAEDRALDVGPLVNGRLEPNGKIEIDDALLILKKAVGILSW